MAQIDALFQKLIECEGSDLHLKQGQKPKMRRHGHLEELDGHDSLSQDHLVGLLKEMASEEGWKEFEQKGDLDFAYSLGETARFRANFFRHYFGFGAIFRHIPSKILSLDELEAPEVLNKLAELSSGLVLVTGPTGSGKSTTLASMIDHINATLSKKIVTIEEPVEFTHTPKKSIITHREVGLDTVSFASGLRNAIKSDVDVILVGEMRDRETIELALTASEMGILVFGTLHTNSASKTIDRIIDVFPAAKKNQIRMILANALQGVVAQQLLRSADGQRRWAAHEILLKTPALTPIIQTGETMKLTSEIQLNGQIGMVLMDACLQQLVANGKVSQEEAYKKALDKESFA